MAWFMAWAIIDWLLGMGNGRVHQHRVAAQFHGDGCVGGSAHARIHQHRDLGFFKDDLQVVRVADAQAGTDQTRPAASRRCSRFLPVAAR